jgi:peptide/nickel transport system permease protein
MYRYVVKRLLMLLLVILGVSFLIYAIMDLAPGDPVWQILGEDATQEEYEAMRAELGFDRPLIIRYGDYMWGLLHGDLGYSYKYSMDVMELYLSRLPATLLLALSATIVSTLISLPLGIYAALRQGSWQDNVTAVFSVLGLATPNFWVGLMLIIIFSLHLGWFHSGGFTSWQDVILPAITVGTGHTALTTRTTRSSMIDVIRQDYLMLARAKGVSEKKVIRRHALKNALIPIITATGIQFTGSLGGSVITESVFSWPGVGRLVVDAIKSQDIDTVTGSIIMTAMITSIILLIVDLLYAFVDPRIKAQYNK